jgi:hypothetical protein
MSRIAIDVGSSPGDGTGDSLHTAGESINSMTTELYAKDADLQSQIDSLPGGGGEGHVGAAAFDDFFNFTNIAGSNAWLTGDTLNAYRPPFMPSAVFTLGTPLLSIQNAPNGWAEFTLDDADESQILIMTLGSGSAQTGDKPIIETRIKLNSTTATGAFASLYLSFSIAISISLSDLPTNYRVNDVDKTTDDTGVSAASGDIVVLKIDATDKAAVKYYINGAQVPNSSTSYDFSSFSDGTTLIPMLRVVKTSGADIVQVDVDYLSVTTAQRGTGSP